MHSIVLPRCRGMQHRSVQVFRCLLKGHSFVVCLMSLLHLHREWGTEATYTSETLACLSVTLSLFFFFFFFSFVSAQITIHSISFDRLNEIADCSKEQLEWWNNFRSEWLSLCWGFVISTTPDRWKVSLHDFLLLLHFALPRGIVFLIVRPFSSRNRKKKKKKTSSHSFSLDQVFSFPWRVVPPTNRSSPIKYSLFFTISLWIVEWRTGGGGEQR